MIIDAHAHACGEFADPRKLTEILDKLGVDKVVLCPGLKGHTSAPIPPNIPISAIKQHPLYGRYFINPGIRFNYNFLLREKQDGNEFVYSLVEEKPDRIIQVYWLDPRKHNFMMKLENDFEKWHFKGIKLHQVCTPFKSDGIEINNIAEFCEEKRLPLIIHLWSDSDALKLLNVARDYIGTTFILLHLVGLEVITEQAKYMNNIHYEISPFSYIKKSRVQYAIDTLGANRIILGSDSPWDKGSLENNIARINSLNITNTEKVRILGDNMKDIFKL
ncbi:MAG TPA: amidohydrolase family protein [Dehalococcoidia bacterium]|nr:amidohydrolase family protein [Dehalococcoidia bacterium]